MVDVQHEQYAYHTNDKRGNTMKKLIILVLLLCLTLVACGKTEPNKDEVYVDKEGSFFSNFVVSDEKVYISCFVCIENNSNREKEILLIGTFADDYEHKLLKEKRLVATNLAEPNEIKLLVPPGGKYFDVVFCGNHGGNMLKQDRLLPQLEIIEIVKQ